MYTSAENTNIRMVGIGIVVASLFFALFGRALYLQVMVSDTFKTAASANQVRLIYTPAPRGRILDRNGRILVDNRTIQAITVQRRATKDHPELLGRLATTLGISIDDLTKSVDDQRYSDYRPVPVAEDVPESASVYLREHQDEFPGVEASEIARRVYPNGVLAAHLLGYVGEINDTELKSQEKAGYKLGDDIGKSGVEQAYESWLRGAPGIRKLEVNSSGRVLRELDTTAPTPGHDLRLTIDEDVQRVTEDSLQQAMKATQGTFDKNSGKHFAAPAGSSVVLDPTNGSVIAMASYPVYDPSQFVNGISTQTFAALQDPANHYPLNNRAIQGQYAPGSTFKLVTATAALQKGLITPGTSLVDTGKLQVGNREFTNASKKSFGPVDLVHAIGVSSDVYFYKIGADFWYAKDKYGQAIQDEASAYGFGKATGIELSGEQVGRVPTPESRKRDHEKNPSAFPESRWFAGDNVNLAIGQGEMVVTPLQLANAYAAFANGGTLYQPHVADRIVDDAGSTVHQFDAKQIGHLDISDGTRSAMMAGFHGATTFGEGTATAAFAGFDQSKFAVAGKTGTAQVISKQDTGLFVGMGPLPQPKYVAVVVIEEGGFGGVASAPVVRRIFDQVSGQQIGAITLGGSAD